MTEPSSPLRAALARLGATIGDDDGLMPEVELHTVLARARTGDAVEVARGVPRLAAALIGGELSPVEGIEVVELLDQWHDTGRHRIVDDVFDAWWLDVLRREPGDELPGHDPGAVLGLLAHVDAPMVRWLHPWLDELDGPAAMHLADAVIDGFSAPTWAGRPDHRQQAMAWTRTETVINGLALIGATHIDDEAMSRVLDILILGGDGTDA